jgi:hypothetical protein
LGHANGEPDGTDKAVAQAKSLKKHIWEIAEELSGEIPEEDLQSLPADTLQPPDFLDIVCLIEPTGFSFL